ncbi:hypothetical protein [Paraliomyxa miuraensis]|uniref:hypothetical protein n=1 Tax=Paraliomyxa miuraensis TaxID=376150 RepID=UPI002255F796|nr:hypothetical protein [Paraliomyxa miuraensis]MCX4247906.1 hypothetical protein [Paraliomyxa miuraensis]
MAATGLCLTTACGPTGVAAETDGESEGSSGTTGDATNTNPTMPMTTTPTTVGDVTSDVTTDTPDVTTDPTLPPEDTTAGMTESCCEPHDAPGCDDEAVVDCVCAQEAACCAFSWDEVCVELAQGDCMAVCDGGTTEGTTTGAGEACSEVVTFEMMPSEATLSGAWMLGMSMVGEGEISVNQMGGPGSILFEPDIPCDDTWYIWVRAFNNGSDDSYFATLDGEPMPEAIFEGDCQNGGQGYIWAPLNWRDQMAGPCTYVEDPWAPDWTTGVHQIEFTYREAAAMGRILITNDQDLVPM